MPLFGVHLKTPEDGIKPHGLGLAEVVNHSVQLLKSQL